MRSLHTGAGEALNRPDCYLQEEHKCSQQRVGAWRTNSTGVGNNLALATNSAGVNIRCGEQIFAAPTLSL